MIPAFCLYMGILIPFSLYSYFLAQYALLWVQLNGGESANIYAPLFAIVYASFF